MLTITARAQSDQDKHVECENRSVNQGKGIPALLPRSNLQYVSITRSAFIQLPAIELDGSEEQTETIITVKPEVVYREPQAKGIFFEDTLSIYVYAVASSGGGTIVGALSL